MITRRIAVLVETSTSWGERIVRGIAAYGKEHGPWLLYLEPRGRYEMLELPRGWSGDGVIARVTTAKLARQIVAAAIPAVNVSTYRFEAEHIPQCTLNQKRCAELAAEHLLGLGLTRFAYCGPPNRPDYDDVLARVFQEMIEAAGFRCESYTPCPHLDDGERWRQDLEQMGQWLADLPKPIGLLAWNDVRGRQITEVYQYKGISVPDEIAVLGGGYDNLMGAVSIPPLSTIDASTEKIGYEAARMLDALMEGRPLRHRRVIIEPRGVVPQQSTDILAIRDPLLAQAIRFIRDRSTRGIGVGEVVEELGVPRRVLELRFRKILGRSPASEIRRVRLDHAKALLADTALPVAKVAKLSGFQSSEVFHRAFRGEMGLTPSQYRRQMSFDQ